MADQYARMNTNQLEAEAQSRGIPLDEFQSLKNNEERAQRLRDHDAARDADAQTAADNAARAAQQQQAQDSGTEQAQASDSVQVDRGQPQDQNQAQTGSGQPRNPQNQGQQQADVAPYPDDGSLANAQAAASGNLSTDESIDTSRAEPVGGDPAYTAPDPNAPENQGQDQDR